MIHEDYTSEGYACEQPIEIERGLDESDLEAVAETREEMNRLYRTAKEAKVGHQVTCPVCRRPFKKRSYQQAFCRNKGRGNCKDRYWNSVVETRSMRAGGAKLW